MSLLGAITHRRVPSLGESTALLEDAVSHRTELATIELVEARRHAQTSALLLGACALLFLFAGFTFTLTLTALVWDSPHRGAWLAGLCAVYLLGAIASALSLRWRLQHWAPLAELRTQLQQDYQCLSRLIKSTIP